MRIIIPSFLSCCIWLMLSACNQSTTNEMDAITTEQTLAAKQRIISLNGSLTELLFLLEMGDEIVGVDVTSTYPEATANIENLGHISRLNVEAILALNPSVVLLSAAEANNQTIEQLRKAQIKIVAIDLENTFESALNAAQQINTALELDKKEAIATLQTTIEQNKEQLAETLKSVGNKPKVLFIYARGTKTLMVGGKGTFADAMLQLVGAENAAAAVDDFKALSPEALLEIQPDAILMFNSGIASLVDKNTNQSGIDALLAIPVIAQTPAGQNKHIITMDGAYLSGFGPRSTQAALELAQKIHKTIE